MAPKAASGLAADPPAGSSDADRTVEEGLASAPAQLNESYRHARRPGTVIGSRSPDGLLRKGVDRERVIGIDNGALRIQPLLTPGWGRAGTAYGPFVRRNGLAFAVFMLNGHNTAQSENLSETFAERLDRWLAGADVVRRRQRLLQWLLSRRKNRMLRQWRWWRRLAKDAAPVPRIDENLALGWFASELPVDPTVQGHGLVMHATGPDNGQLWARVGEHAMPAVHGVQNLQIHYVVVLREQGAAYYAASVPGANGLGAYPDLRPLAIDPCGSEPLLHAGLFQSTLGQIGFRLDTRVYGQRVAAVAEWAAWYGSAHAADRLEGQGVLAESRADTGARWRQLDGCFERTANGLEARADGSLAVLEAPAPSGLLHVMIEFGAAAGPPVSLLWRHADARNHWRVTAASTGCELAVCEDGRWTILALDAALQPRAHTAHSLQVLDDGRRIGVHWDGALAFGARFDDARLSDATGIGIAVSTAGNGVRLSRFEAHPRSCRLPRALDQGAPWWRLGTQRLMTESFEGPPRDLAAKPTTTGGAVWQRCSGEGQVRLTGTGAARVDGNAEQPNPGRLVYTVDWPRSDFADLEIAITPPGARRGDGEHGRAGLVFWQDESNFVLVNNWLNDSYGGASVSCFSCLGGFEDLYDAVWSNVGERIRWGIEHTLRIAFDGMHLLVLLDGEPVLYRALTDIYADATRLDIRRVGLIANWEWGNDTGSEFRRFCARA
jgi:hypothetical protein